MKYIDIPQLAELSSQLSLVNQAMDSQVTVGIEIFSTKPTANDKRLQKTLDHQLESSSGATFMNAVGSYDNHDSSASYLLSPPTSVSDTNAHVFPKRRAYSSSVAELESPFGPMDQGGSRKQYAYLISVLNSSDPDRDFSALQPDHFKREYESSSRIIQGINHTLNQILGSTRLPADMWSTIDQEIDLRECKIFHLTLPQAFLQDDDSGTVWCKMWFFFNKRRKRVLFMYMKTARISYSDDDDSYPDRDTDNTVLGDLD